MPQWKRRSSPGPVQQGRQGRGALGCSAGPRYRPVPGAPHTAGSGRTRLSPFPPPSGPAPRRKLLGGRNKGRREARGYTAEGRRPPQTRRLWRPLRRHLLPGGRAADAGPGAALRSPRRWPGPTRGPGRPGPGPAQAAGEAAAPAPLHNGGPGALRKPALSAGPARPLARSLPSPAPHSPAAARRGDGPGRGAVRAAGRGEAGRGGAALWGRGWGCLGRCWCDASRRRRSEKCAATERPHVTSVRGGSRLKPLRGGKGGEVGNPRHVHGRFGTGGGGKSPSARDRGHAPSLFRPLSGRGRGEGKGGAGLELAAQLSPCGGSPTRPLVWGTPCLGRGRRCPAPPHQSPAPSLQP